MPTEIKVPTLGESVTSATIARWLKQEGDAVAADEPLVELETDKVTVEVNAPAPGVLGAILQKDGAEVEVGAVLGEIADAGGAASKTRKAEAKPVEAKAAPAKTAPEPAMATPSTQAPGPASAGGKTEIVVPTLGESVTTATISRWLKKPGDAVKADEPLVELETDKVSVEVNAPASGTLEAIAAPDGTEIEVGAVIGTLATASGAVAPSNKPAARPDAGVNPPPRANGPVARPATPPADRAAALEAFPSAAKRMAEAGVSAGEVGRGTGKDGRITKGDVLDFIAKPAASSSGPAAKPAPAPAARAARTDEPRDERVKMTRLRRTIASRLKEAQNTAAMLTTFNEVDMSAAMSLRTQYKDAFEKKNNGVRLGFMSFFVRACVAGLKEFPAVNAEIDGDDIVYKNYVHMGIAVGGANGLVVPVLRDVDQMGFAEIEGAIGAFGKRARDGQLKLDELTGGTFSITNGGVYGSLMSTPIINPPQSAILGMHKIQERPVAIAGKVEVRPMMYLALTYDHRIVDGKEAVSFLVRVKEAIEDPRRLLLGL